MSECKKCIFSDIRQPRCWQAVIKLSTSSTQLSVLLFPRKLCTTSTNASQATCSCSLSSNLNNGSRINFRISGPTKTPAFNFSSVYIFLNLPFQILKTAICLIHRCNKLFHKTQFVMEWRQKNHIMIHNSSKFAYLFLLLHTYFLKMHKAK